jgi:all-trans-retinol 13,14-reductase
MNQKNYLKIMSNYFKSKNLNFKYDIIIVGSGLGGLVCGYILAKNGYKVAIFEKNAQLGGCLQTFTRKGVKFGTGMHYTGSMGEGEIMHRFFKYLNLLGNVQLSPMNKECYEVISIGSERYKYAAGMENFVRTLSTQFPDNVQDIKLYAEKITDIARSSPIHNLSQLGTNVFLETDYIKKSVDEFLAEITQNPRLQAVLAGNMMLYAGVKDKTPIYLHALMTNFYNQSPYRLTGGSDEMVKSLIKSIENFGGKIYKNAEIEEFVCDSEKMTKVRLKNGQEFEAQNFISAIHPQVSLEKIHSPLLRKVYRDRINSIENTISCFTVYVKFKPETHNYLNYNYYYYDNENIWNIYDENLKNFPASYYLLHQCSEKHEEKYVESAEIVAFMEYERVKKWENTTVGKRGQDYENFKQEYAEKLIDKVEESFAGFRAAIDEYWTATPLTYRDYTATAQGSMYGILHDRNFPIQTRISQRTKIPNFFFTGQNINSHGLLGVIVGSLVTCAEFLGTTKLINEILQK